MDTPEWVEISANLLVAGASDRGGYSRRQVELLGLPWPLPRGWKKSVIGKLIPKRAADEFLRLSNGHLAGKLKKADSPETISRALKPGRPLQLYVLALTGDHFYVGLTHDLDQRIKQHASGATVERFMLYLESDEDYEYQYDVFITLLFPELRHWYCPPPLRPDDDA